MSAKHENDFADKVHFAASGDADKSVRVPSQITNLLHGREDLIDIRQCQSF